MNLLSLELSKRNQRCKLSKEILTDFKPEFNRNHNFEIVGGLVVEFGLRFEKMKI